MIYQIYPRSFMDSNGDGIGDLSGIRAKLDYVAGLGVDAIWISPFFPSPMKDFGYDVADYRGVDPIFGRLDDFRSLLARAHQLGLRVIIDQVLSHSSDQHAWFAESRQDRTNPKADWYVWADPKPDGSPPNNWMSYFGGSAWTWESQRLQYYLHNFLDCQPDLNFHNPQVRQAQLDNLRFWLELGVDGVRLDVVNFYFHSQGLEPNPPVPAGEKKMHGASADNPYAWQRHLYDISQPQNVQFLKQIRAVLNEFPGSTSVGELSSADPISLMAEYTSGNDKLHMAYTFDLLSDHGNAGFIRQVIADTEARIGDGWPCWAISNHDVMRCVSRWTADNHVTDSASQAAFAQVLLAMLLSLRGSVSLYQGDELGLPEAQVPLEKIRDPYGLPFWPVYKGRDGCRTPMVWSPERNGDFTDGEPWLPVDSAQRALSVASQERQSDSTLQAARQLIAWRQQQPALIGGAIDLIDDDSEILCWVRHCERQRLLVAFNLTGATQRMVVPCEIQHAISGHGFSGRIENGEIVLEPHQALFAELAKVADSEAA